MKTKIITILISVFFFIKMSSQVEPKLWYFGEGCGLDFNYNPPTMLNNTLSRNSEGGVTITKEDGTLLFFVNFDEIYNANGLIMKNGRGLIGNSGSSAQSPIVLQHPTVENLFYLFYAADHGNNIGELRYSIIDLCGDNGLGEVVSNKKNVLIPGVFTERLNFAYNKGGNYYWILAGTRDIHSIKAFKLNEFGLDLSPITSIINDNSVPSYIGMINLSKDFSKLTYSCCLSGGFRGAKIGDFDLISGKISNMENFVLGEVYDCVFSNDNTFIYFTEFWANSRLMRYNTIDKSSITLDTQIGNYGICAVEMGPDGNIYVANQGRNSIGVIENVGKNNEIYNKNKFVFKSPNNVKNGLQSSNRIYGIKDKSNVEIHVLGNDTTVCNFENFVLKSGVPNSVWSNGEVGSDLVVKAPGIYFFQYSYCDEIISDTIQIFLQESNLIETNTILVSCNEVNLSSDNANKLTIWNTGDINDSLKVNESGIYWSISKLGCDIFIDTFEVKIERKPIPLEPKYTLCEKSLNGLYLLSNQDVLWSNGHINDSLLIEKGGIYYFTISNVCGEFKSETEVVDFTNLVLPNIFSPNGDNINDFFPGFTFPVPSYSLEIYDRWGELVYKGNHDWDGKFNNIAVVVGVYTYIFKNIDCNSNFISTITVIH